RRSVPRSSTLERSRCGGQDQGDRTRPIELKAGRTFEARLKLGEGEVRFDFGGCPRRGRGGHRPWGGGPGLDRASDRPRMARVGVVVATKVFNPMGPGANERGLSSKHIRHAIDASLRRLQLDYIDLYQIHRFDEATPIQETLEALDAVVRAGKALHIGASSM